MVDEFDRLKKKIDVDDKIRVRGERRSTYRGATTEGDPIDRIYKITDIYTHAIILKGKGKKPYFIKRGMHGMSLFSASRLIGVIFQIDFVE